MYFGFILATADVEVSDDEDNRQLSDLIRYQSDDLEDEIFETPHEFTKVTDEQINQLF